MRVQKVSLKLRMASSSEKYLEFFIGCRSLGISSSKDIGTFVVVSTRDDDEREYKELGRTETVCSANTTQYCTSFLIQYAVESIPSFIVRFDIYARRSETTERLSDQEHLGKATVPLNNILLAPGNHYTGQIAGLTKGAKKGVLTISAEEVDMSNPEMNSTIELDMRAVVLRKRDWQHTIIPQRYELRRAHRHDDVEGEPVWLPIHRSDRISKQRDSNLYVDFTRASFSHRHMCNGDDERQLRVVVSSGSAKRSSPDGDIGYVDLTLRDICEIDPTEEVFEIERDDMSQDLGHIKVLKADPTDYGSHFALLLNYTSCDRYTTPSGIADGAKAHKKPAKRKRRLAKARNSITRQISGFSETLSPSELFSGQMSDV